MSTITFVIVRLLVSLVAISFAMEVLAYYNPTTGAWLSRDPVEEPGERNLYCFVHNMPTGFVDPDGRIMGAYQPQCGKVENCNPFNVSQRALDAEARHHNLELDPDPYGGGYRHCVAACILARCFTVIGQAMTRIRDMWDEQNNPRHPQYQDSQRDIAAERNGERIAASFWIYSSRDCEGACLEAYPAMQGPVRPRISPAQ
jgi:hypothetical protein